MLITGGAGFIGSHLADELLLHGYNVRILDALLPQVHGSARERPDYLDPEVELVVGDVRNADDVGRALEGVDAVYHFAAAVGVGQSMYEIAHYTSVNTMGTAVLLEALSQRPVERLVVASSMSIYGEGLYRRPDGTIVAPPERPREQFLAGEWELKDVDGAPLEPIPTDETKVPVASSVYALSKYDQERLCLIVGGAYRIPAVALRFFNVYGPRQALSNPYTGVLAIFSSRYLNGKPPLIFEDGEQRRDFVNVHDVARACRLALESPRAVGEVFNVGSGRPVTINEIARQVGEALGRTDVAPEVTRKYRVGDIRHCFADIAKARELLGYEPWVEFRDGLVELGEWLAEEGTSQDHTARAGAELAARGLVV